MQFSYRKIPKHWKYQLIEEYWIWLAIEPGFFETDFLLLDSQNYLTIKKGYAWDGSTAVPDTKACMRASLVHDALYALMREGKLDFKHRDYADQMYRDMCIEDGMWRWHANLRYWGLKHFAGKYAKPKGE